MFDSFDYLKEYGSIVVIVLSILAIFVSGLFFGITYYLMDVTETQFENVDCDLGDNLYASNCQELFDISLYPFFALREILVWASFFFIFGLVIGMLLLGYQAGKSPILLGLLVVFIIALTYIGIEVSNIYRTMLETDIIRQMMVEFTVYNKVMLYFPWFVFIVSLMSVMLSLANFQRSKVNTSSTGSVDELDY